MEKILQVYSLNETDSTEALSFFVSTKLNDESIIEVGNFMVEENGTVVGEISQSFNCGDPKLLINAKKMLLQSGLQEIVGNYVPVDEIFIDSDSVIYTNSNFIDDQDPKRWQRAKEYVLKNNISVKSILGDNIYKK